MGRMMREYFLPLLTNVGVIQFLKHDPEVPDSDVTPEYCARHNWLIGSPATVVEKIERMYDEVGGFGAHAAVLLRLQRKPRGLAPIDAAARPRGDAQSRPPDPEIA